MGRFLPPISIFEKVLVANTAIILIEALAAWWVTRHALESYHYLIDTSFLVAMAVVSLLINTLLLRAAFRPLFGLLGTIQLIEAGRLDCRAQISARDSDVFQVATALNAMLDRLEALRHQTAGEILHAQEQERRRLALELHDQSSQTLTALTMHTQVLEDLLTTDVAPSPVLLRRQVAQVSQLAGRTMTELRHVAEQLRPVILDDLGLEAALRWLAEDVGQGTRLRVLAHISAGKEGVQAQRLPSEVETTLFRIAQEALTNVTRHAQASQVDLTLVRGPEQVTLLICDNGRGFAPAVGAGQRAGLGLTGMQERARLVGGKLEITSHAEQGTTIQANIPVAMALVEQRSL
jgi:two-component system, NarL family, sensor histidine kinase UhpB